MSRATLGIISIGDMGVGIAKLLIAHDYKVITNISGRSKATYDRAQANSIQIVADDIELCNSSDVILSIVPPRDAVEVAQRIAEATSSPKYKHDERKESLYFLDLNAISPARAREIEALFASSSSSAAVASQGVQVKMIDGGIIGGPPHANNNNNNSTEDNNNSEWTRPSIPLSGPHHLQPHLAKVLNTRHISDEVGSASGLKMCYASLSKGFTALAIGSYTTAKSLGVLEELQHELDERSPGVRGRAERGLVGMAPKAYRWVDKMREIAKTFEVDGGFHQETESPFRAIAEIYQLVAHGTELGKEVIGNRQRGQTAEDVAGLVEEGTKKRKG